MSNPLGYMPHTVVHLDTEGGGQQWDFTAGIVHEHYEWSKMVTLSNGLHRVTLRIEF